MMTGDAPESMMYSLIAQLADSKVNTLSLQQKVASREEEYRPSQITSLNGHVLVLIDNDTNNNDVHTQHA